MIELRWVQNLNVHDPTTGEDRSLRRALLVKGWNKGGWPYFENVSINSEKVPIEMEHNVLLGQDVTLPSSRFTVVFDQASVPKTITTRVILSSGWGIVDVQDVPRAPR